MDIHNYKRRLDIALEKIKDKKFAIPEDNKVSIREFSKHLINKGLNIARVEHYISNLKNEII